MNTQFLAASAVAVVFLTNGAPASQRPALAHLPYTSAHDPQFIRASHATFMNDEDRVIGVMTGKTARAFPPASCHNTGWWKISRREEQDDPPRAIGEGRRRKTSPITAIA
jgi:hypothetical protein